jgi:hypothetical protein
LAARACSEVPAALQDARAAKRRKSHKAEKKLPNRTDLPQLNLVWRQIRRGMN